MRHNNSNSTRPWRQLSEARFTHKLHILVSPSPNTGTVQLENLVNVRKQKQAPCAPSRSLDRQLIAQRVCSGLQLQERPQPSPSSFPNTPEVRSRSLRDGFGPTQHPRFSQACPCREPFRGREFSDAARAQRLLQRALGSRYKLRPDVSATNGSGAALRPRKPMPQHVTVDLTKADIGTKRLPGNSNRSSSPRRELRHSRTSAAGVVQPRQTKTYSGRKEGVGMNYLRLAERVAAEIGKTRRRGK